MDTNRARAACKEKIGGCMWKCTQWGGWGGGGKERGGEGEGGRGRAEAGEVRVEWGGEGHSGGPQSYSLGLLHKHTAFRI